jgi:hypothetical protein
MKKRFTDADKWEDEWFSELEPKYKLFWQYILDRCDIAGVWKVNFRLAVFHIGEPLNEDETLHHFNGRIEDVGRGRWWVKGFVAFQYPSLNDRSPVHRRIMQLIANHGLHSKSGNPLMNPLNNP